MARFCPQEKPEGNVKSICGEKGKCYVAIWVGRLILWMVFFKGSTDPCLAFQPPWPPEGDPVFCAVTRAASFSSVDKEKRGNNGILKKLRLKGVQEFVLFDMDANPVKGKLISGALLHLRSASPKKAPLARVGVSSLSSDWKEGYSSFDQALQGEKNWAYPGSNLMDVTFGRGNTIWRFADCSLPDNSGWQVCAVEPDVVASLVSGLSFGFGLSDEVGNIWSSHKGKFKYTYFPNRSFYNHKKKGSSPWLEVWTKGRDNIPPNPVEKIQVAHLPVGETSIRWKTPKDQGGGRTLGFLVNYRQKGEDKTIPRYLIPMAGRNGEEVEMYLRDLSFQAGETILITIRPVDSAGNIGKPTSRKVTLSMGSTPPSLSKNTLPLYPPEIKLPEVGGIKVSVIDFLDKVDPITGKMIPIQGEGYKGGNHLFSARQRIIQLQAAKNETICFQLNMEGVSPKITIDWNFKKYPKLKPKLFEFAYVRVPGTRGQKSYFLPDPLIPYKGSVSIPSNAGVVNVPGQQNHSLIFEVYVPHNEPHGKKLGKMTISSRGEKIDLNVELMVWNFTLPNKLSFVPEMNAYWYVSPYQGYEFYRLAHEHRTCLNRLPYGWDGQPEFAPHWKGEDFDWLVWDQNISPLVDGSAFRDLPRHSEPVDVFYLPFNENWPISLAGHYKPSYWADEAFSLQYAENFKKAISAFARHCYKKKWHGTKFQFFLNNKIYHRKTYILNSAPWIFDEPVNIQDFWALHWFGQLWEGAITPYRGRVKLGFRADISLIQFSRNLLQGVVNYLYVGDNNIQKTRMIREDFQQGGKGYFAEYGTINRIEESNFQPLFWCLSAWAKGASGILPWQTIGGKDCWQSGDQTAIFYPYGKEVMPSIRLKAFTRGQQDVEYLTLFCRKTKRSQINIGDWLNGMINLDGKVQKNSNEDAGTIIFEGKNNTALWLLRGQIGNWLSEKGPAYSNIIKVKKEKTLKKMKIPNYGYTSVSPEVQRYRPGLDGHM
jgi:hypothetical protein